MARLMSYQLAVVAQGVLRLLLNWNAYQNSSQSEEAKETSLQQ